MKKKLFLLNFILLLCVTMNISCIAFDDCRFLKNQSSIEMIKKRCKDIEKANGLGEDAYILYENTIFMLSYGNKVIGATPILDICSLEMVGEIVTEVKINETEKIDTNSILNYFTSNSDELSLSFSSPKFLSVPFGNQNKNPRHTSSSLFASFLDGVDIKDSDRIYFIAENSDIENPQIIHETLDKKITRFEFQPPFGIKRIPEPKPIIPASKKSWLWSFFKTNESGYIRLPSKEKTKKE